MSETINIAVVDDHGLYRKGLINLINSLNEHFNVISESGNGELFFDGLDIKNLPDIAIVDIDMPVMNGFETAEKLKLEFPQINTLIITMMEDENSLIQMLKLGVKGFLSKDVEPEELKMAIERVSRGNFHHNEALTGKLIHALQKEDEPDVRQNFNDREFQFLKLSCSEMTYKEIADQMCLSPKTIDGYRAALFERLEIKSRVGLVMYAIKNEIVKLD